MALQEAGFDGVFEEDGLRKGTTQFVSAADGSIQWPTDSPPWPTYENFFQKSIIRPVRLHGTSPQQFTIMTVGPTIMPLIRMLKAYNRAQESLADCIAAVRLWADSLHHPSMSTLCIALMAIHGSQVSPASFPVQH